ncbi:hypothetical protein BDI4_560114 [Burkholderia diffusa]|nr:hypothetical protein BDI4_560114 [Burkholderia diffusa]
MPLQPQTGCIEPPRSRLSSRLAAPGMPRNAHTAPAVRGRLRDPALVQVLRRPKQASGTSESASSATGQSLGDSGPYLRMWAGLCQFWS